MKNILLAFALFFVPFCWVGAQTFPYQFAYTNEPYTELTDGTALPLAAVWDEGAKFPLGFFFQFGGVTYDSLVIFGMSAAIIPSQESLSSDTIDAILGYSVGAPLMSTAATKVRFLTEGNAPDRIAKVELSHLGFDGTGGSVSLQIWLYETSNTIQIRLGEQDIQDPANTFFNGVSPLIGFMLHYQYLSDYVSFFPQAQFVVGDPSAPADSIVVNAWLDETVSNGPQYGLSGVPLDYSVFTFFPGVVGVRQAQLRSLRLSPNPAQEVVQLEGLDPDQATQVQVLDVQGRIRASMDLPAGEVRVSLPDALAPGLYWLRCTNGTKRAYGKLIKG